MTSRNASINEKSNVDRSSLQQKHKGPAPSSASAPASTKRGEFYNLNSQKFRARPVHSQSSVSQGGIETPTCAKCGRTHLGVFRDGVTGFFKNTRNNNFMKV